jgi:hypothetical protein
MRYFIPILFLIFALFSLQTGLIRPGQSGPGQEAVAFLKDIQSGNLTQIVRHFGGNTCRCPARNGWGAFLAYQPGQETNLAFLLGRQFSIGQPIAKKIKSPPQAKYAAPFEQPEDYVVDVPIAFNKIEYSPSFLPLAMAYGKTMTWQQLQDFLDDPAREASRGFSLRLRPGVAPGAIKFNTTTIAPNILGEFKFLKPAAFNEIKVAETKKDTKDSENQFLVPQDAGPVIMSDGARLTCQKLTEVLPRLKSLTIRFHVVRRGKFQPWTIFHFLLQNAIVEENDGTKTIPLHN